MKHNYFPRILSFDDLKNKFKFYSKSINQIDYYMLMNKLDNKESFILYVGAYWCPNCIAIMEPFVNALGNKEAFMLDPRRSAKHKRITDIRSQLTTDTENKFLKLCSHLKCDLPLNENGSYKIRIPFIIKVENGVGKSFFSEEYKPYEVTNDLKVEIENKISKIINA